MPGIVLSSRHTQTHLIFKIALTFWYLSFNTYKCSFIHKTYPLVFKDRLDSHIYMNIKNTSVFL